MKTIEIINKRINFDQDIQNNSKCLIEAIENSNVLIIGGAGTIGSSYIKQLFFTSTLC